MSRVLVVEADPGLRQGVVRMLQRLGHTPLPADDAPAALRALARKRVDVVLMDIDMPAPGGFGLLRQINEGEHPPVVGMGTDPEADDIILLMRLGGVDFVRRPVSLEVLDGALARAARRGSASMALGSGRDEGTTEPGRSKGAAKSKPVRRARASRSAGFASSASASTMSASRSQEARRPSRSKEASKEKEEVPPTGRDSDPLVERIRVTLQSLRDGRLNLPVMGGVAHSIFSLSEDDEIEVDRVVDLVSTDPGFAIEVLRAAQTGKYSSARAVTSLRDACMQLGNLTVLALAQEVLVSRLHQLGSGPLARTAARMWRNSRILAQAVRLLAADDPRVAPEKAFLAALLHNIGEILVLQALAAIRDAGGPELDGEATLARVYGSIHERVGARFLKAWSAPEYCCKLAGKHHEGRGAVRARLHLVGERPESRALRTLVMDVWVLSLEEGHGYGAEAGRAVPSSDWSRSRRIAVTQAVREAAKAVDQESKAEARSETMLRAEVAAAEAGG